MIRILILLSYLSFMTVTATTTAPDVVPTRIQRAPAISPRRNLQGGGGNDKNGGGGGGGGGNDKNKDPTQAPSIMATDSPKPSPSPSAVPSRTIMPTTADRNSPEPTPEPTHPPTPRPTVAPTPGPTTSMPSPSPTTEVPSNAPSTPDPSAAPSGSPTVAGIVGHMNVTFSLLADGVTATSVLVGQDEALVAVLKESLDYYLCNDLKFVLLTDSDEPICPATQKTRFLDEEEEDDEDDEDTVYWESVLYPDQRRLILKDRTDDDFQFTSWQVEYPVNRVGTKFQEMAQDSNPAATMQNVAQLAINVRIQEGDFDRRLSTGATMEVETAVLGQEFITWTAESTFDPLNPAPLHPLRIAGMALFVFSCLATWFITHLATKRRIQKEWDAEFKERGKGGLVTEAGVDYMLEAGRHQSAQMADEEEQSTKLPLPGYMNVAQQSSSSN